MNLGRNKKKQAQSPAQPPAKPEAPRTTIFGGIVVPELYKTFSHEGLEIYSEYGCSKIKNFCTRCGGDVQISNATPWQEIISSGWLCGDCVWHRDKYEGELLKTTTEIEELEGLRKKLFAAFSGLLGREPASLEEDALRKVGLILHREDSEAVLGFILIDYSREQMHKLVTTVNGRLEPFSRGFKLFLPLEYYKLFPGSSGCGQNHGGLYRSYHDGSYLDRLRERKTKLETRAELIQARVTEHKSVTDEIATH